MNNQTCERELEVPLGLDRIVYKTKRKPKPQLQGKTLITFGEKWQYGIKNYFELLLESQNALIDYLKAKEKKDESKD